MIEHDDSHHGLLTPDDDALHPPSPHRWFHETAWFWFHVPERRLGGWLYNWVRPNVGTSGGGCWIWDDSAWFHMEVPYYACYNNLPLPECDDGVLRFASGTTITTLDPLTSYRLEFVDRDIISVDLVFDAVMEPWVAEADGEPPVAHHLDQVGRVHGELVLRGETIPVDCLAIRDRTWSLRSERWKDGRVGYCNAATTDLAFLAQSAAAMRGEDDDRVRTGYYLRDGRRARLVDGSRVIERDPEHGHLRTIRVEAEDTDGRRFTAEGTGLNAMAMPIPGVHAVVWSCLVDWSIDGVRAWGEDQDAWPLHEWTVFRRRGVDPST